MDKPKKWRLVQNEWNESVKPWFGGIGVEEDDDDMSVPALVCWFFRGTDEVDVQRMIDQRNVWVDSLK